METVNKNIVTIYLETNPNPNSLKFVANFMLVDEGDSYDFPDKKSALNAPLAEELFDLPYVNRVFYMSNFVTVTKSDHVDWTEIQDTLKQHIKNYLEEEKPLLTADYQKPQVAVGETNESDIEHKIRSILDEYVKPAVESDGGAIAFDSFEDGVVTVILQGSCSGCPSSTLTLKAGIENLLKRMLPEVESVEAVGVR